MSRLDGLRARLRDLLHPVAARARTDEELQFHLEMEAERLVTNGVARAEAARVARARFGGVQHHRESLADRRIGAGGALARDARQAWRSLTRSPAFVASTVSSLALGFALAAVATVVVTRYAGTAFPYPRPDRLFHVMYATPNFPEPRGLPRDIWEALAPSVSETITTSGDTYYFSAPSEGARGVRASLGFMRGLGVRATIGRTLIASDYEGGEAVAMISDRLWRNRFNADSSVIGRTLLLAQESAQGQPTTVRVVGVLPPRFWFGRDSRELVDLLLPLTTPARTYLIQLADGVAPATIEAGLTSIVKSSAASIPDGWTQVRLESMPDRYFASARPIIRLAVVAVALVLIATWANVAIMTLLRLSRRDTEVAVRLALGAGRFGLARMLLAEVAMVGAAGVLIGLSIAALVLRVGQAAIEAQLGRPSPAGPSSFGIDPVVAGVVAALLILLIALLSLVPVALPWTQRIATALRAGGRGLSSGRGITRLRGGLIAAEVALTMILLAAGGLALRSAHALAETSLGFDDSGLVRARVVLRSAGYPTPEAYQSFFIRATSAIGAMTGSAPVFVNMPPFYEPPPITIESDDARSATASLTPVSAGFFSILRIDLHGGREFTETDGVGGEAVVVISASLARALWPEGSALGRRIRSIDAMNPGIPAVWRTVIGVASDIRQTYEDRTTRDFYVPMFQHQLGRYGSFYWRGSSDPAAVQTLRSAIAGVDPTAFTSDLVSVAEQNRRLGDARGLSRVLAAFAIVAAALCGLGLYAVISFATHQRRHETAIRMALGADTGRIVSGFLSSGAPMVAVGLGGGIIGALGVGRLLQHQLFGVGASDPITIAAVAGLLGGIAILATALPAFRAARTDCLTVLRQP